MIDYLPFVLLLGGFLVGYWVGGRSVSVLKEQLFFVRDELARRDQDLGKRAAREDRLITAFMNKLGAPLGDGEMPRTIDRSAKYIARLKKDERNREALTEQEKMFKAAQETL